MGGIIFQNLRSLYGTVNSFWNRQFLIKFQPALTALNSIFYTNNGLPVHGVRHNVGRTLSLLTPTTHTVHNLECGETDIR